jgi:tetratricopeptide (TPR) repeat protein
MERGAVEGKVFHSGAVATLASDALRPNVPSRLLALARKELIRPDRADFAGEDAFRFRHLLIRDAAYLAMPKELRADLHERYAAWLEQAAGDRLSEYEEILAHHLEQAYRYLLELGPADERTRELARAAAGRLLSAADRAQRRGDFPAARTQLERAVELLEGSERARALVELALTDGHLHDFPAAAAAAEAALTEAEAAGDRVALLRARVVRAGARGQFDPTFTLGRARREIDEARAELEALGDEKGVAWGMVAASRSAFFAGRCDEATEIAERLLERLPDLSARERWEVVVTLLVAGYFGTADVDELERLHDRVRRIMTVEGPLTEEMLALNVIARHAMQGHESEVVADAERIERLWDEIGDLGLRVTSNQWVGECMRLVGRFEDAERFFRRGVQGLDRLGETGFNSTMTAMLALTLSDLGRWDEAEGFVERSREMSAPDDFAAQAEWRQARARILAFRGRPAEALVLLDEVVQLVESTDYLTMKADTRELRGHVLAALGRIDEARAALGRAMRDFERKGSLLAVARVRARLEELAA